MRRRTTLRRAPASPAVLVGLALAGAAACARDPSYATGEELLAAMHDAYADRWYRTLVFQQGRLVQRQAQTNDLLTLGFDVYGQPPARTARVLRAKGYDLAKVRADRRDGRPVWVVGAGVSAWNAGERSPRSRGAWEAFSSSPPG